MAQQGLDLSEWVGLKRGTQKTPQPEADLELYPQLSPVSSWIGRGLECLEAGHLPPASGGCPASPSNGANMRLVPIGSPSIRRDWSPG